MAEEKVFIVDMREGIARGIWNCSDLTRPQGERKWERGREEEMREEDKQTQRETDSSNTREREAETEKLVNSWLK